MATEPNQQGSPARQDPAGHGIVAAAHEPELDTGGLLYGTVVSAAALAVGASRGDTAGGLIETMLATLAIYWLAHVYTATVRARRPGTPILRMIGHAARAESVILLGGLPAVAGVIVLHIAHVSLWATVLTDLGVVVVVLAVDGLLAGLQAGTRGWRLGVEAASAALFGGLLAILLVSLHRH